MFWVSFEVLSEASIGYLTYGDSLRDSVINSLQIKWIQQCVNIFITLHLVLTLTIVFNPINQEAEEILRVPQCKFFVREDKKF